MGSFPCYLSYSLALGLVICSFSCFLFFLLLSSLLSPILLILLLRPCYSLLAPIYPLDSVVVSSFCLSFCFLFFSLAPIFVLYWWYLLSSSCLVAFRLSFISFFCFILLLSCRYSLHSLRSLRLSFLLFIHIIYYIRYIKGRRPFITFISQGA